MLTSRVALFCVVLSLSTLLPGSATTALASTPEDVAAIERVFQLLRDKASEKKLRGAMLLPEVRRAP